VLASNRARTPIAPARRVHSIARPGPPAPRTTAIGALAYYVSHASAGHYEPTNITFGIMEPLESPPRNKLDRKSALSTRALADLDGWIAARPDGGAT